MKKTFAFVGAGALGLTAGGLGLAAPAHADATEACESLADHEITTAADPGNWYMDCVPQYGLGKAEFTIVPNLDDPAEEFPAGFAPLDESPPVEYSSTHDFEAMTEYLSGDLPSELFAAPISPVQDLESSPTSQTWGALVIAPITGVAEATEENVPASVVEACGLAGTPYGAGWVATFGEVDTTFTQEIDGESWRFDVVGTPQPVFFFGTIVQEDGFATISEVDPWCVSDGFGTFDNNRRGLPLDFLFGLVTHGIPADPDGFLVTSFGTFGRFEAAPPQLAATGSDSLVPMIAGGSLALFGAALSAAAGLAKRRKQA